MKTYQQRAQKKEYHGVFHCTFHDFLAEMLALKPDTVCRTCYKDLAKHQVQHIAAVMVQILLMRLKIGELFEMHEESKIKLDATMQAFGEYQVEMEERLNELMTAEGPAVLTVLQATYLSESKLLRKQLQAIGEMFKEIDPGIDTSGLEIAAGSPLPGESKIIPISSHNGNETDPSRKK